jgi:hypothetical protein
MPHRHHTVSRDSKESFLLHLGSVQRSPVQMPDFVLSLHWMNRRNAFAGEKFTLDVPDVKFRSKQAITHQKLDSSSDTQNQISGYPQPSTQKPARHPHV